MALDFYDHILKSSICSTQKNTDDIKMRKQSLENKSTIKKIHWKHDEKCQIIPHLKTICRTFNSFRFCNKHSKKGGYLHPCRQPPLVLCRILLVNL